MRRRRFRSPSIVPAIALIAALTAAVAWPAQAQTGIAKEGALFLLVPVGARPIAQGQAAVASRLGADGIWWNPAALGWEKRREMSVDHAKNAFITGDAVDVVLPAGRAGVVGASLLYFNFGDQAATDEFGNTIGTIYSRAIVLAGAYAATFGDRVSAGLAYKFIEQAQTCGGACQNQTTFTVSTSAVDFGVHVVVDQDRRLTLGGAIRNVGFGLQTIDREQTDALPARIHLGADYNVGAITRAIPSATLHAAAEVVSRIVPSSPAVRVGAELGLAERVFLRAGAFTASGDGSRASIGFGIRQGTLGLDFARTFGGISADAGEPPTYVSLRIAFR